MGKRNHSPSPPPAMTQGDDESQTSGKEEVDEVPVPVTVGAETKKTRRPPDPENSRPPTVLNVGIDDLFPTIKELLARNWSFRIIVKESQWCLVCDKCSENNVESPNNVKSMFYRGTKCDKTCLRRHIVPIGLKQGVLKPDRADPFKTSFLKWYSFEELEKWVKTTFKSDEKKGEKLMSYVMPHSKVKDDRPGDFALSKKKDDCFDGEQVFSFNLPIVHTTPEAIDEVFKKGPVSPAHPTPIEQAVAGPVADLTPAPCAAKSKPPPKRQNKGKAVQKTGPPAETLDDGRPLPYKRQRRGAIAPQQPTSSFGRHQPSFAHPRVPPTFPHPPTLLESSPESGNLIVPSWRHRSRQSTPLAPSLHHHASQGCNNSPFYSPNWSSSSGDGIRGAGQQLTPPVHHGSSMPGRYPHNRNHTLSLEPSIPLLRTPSHGPNGVAQASVGTGHHLRPPNRSSSSSASYSPVSQSSTSGTGSQQSSLSPHLSASSGASQGPSGAIARTSLSPNLHFVGPPRLPLSSSGATEDFLGLGLEAPPSATSSAFSQQIPFSASSSRHPRHFTLLGRGPSPSQSYDQINRQRVSASSQSVSFQQTPSDPSPQYTDNGHVMQSRHDLQYAVPSGVPSTSQRIHPLPASSAELLPVDNIPIHPPWQTVVPNTVQVLGPQETILDLTAPDLLPQEDLAFMSMSVDDFREAMLGAYMAEPSAQPPAPFNQASPEEHYRRRMEYEQTDFSLGF